MTQTLKTVLVHVAVIVHSAHERWCIYLMQILVMVEDLRTKVKKRELSDDTSSDSDGAKKGMRLHSKSKTSNRNNFINDEAEVDTDESSSSDSGVESTLHKSRDEVELDMIDTKVTMKRNTKIIKTKDGQMSVTHYKLKGKKNSKAQV